MNIADLHLPIIFVFYVYGLAFFSMGTALTLEISRSPRLAERRLLQPLAVFGLMHGIHEWLEIYLLQAEWLNASFPEWISWARVGWLSLSFIPLVLFGVLGISPGQSHKKIELYTTAVLLVLSLLVAVVVATTSVVTGDALSRYLLAVTGGLLAGRAFYLRYRRVKAEGKQALANRFLWAGLGFGLYGLTQLFVPQADFFPARHINAPIFLETVGIPIQVIRAGAALLITVNLLKATQIVERERENQLLSAQKERLEAMEQVQEEMLRRENLRRDLLRHIVIAQEEERARIARELHDETAQTLTAFTLNLATLRNMMKKKNAATEVINQLQHLSRQMARSLHGLVHDLRPAQLDDLGLVPTLEYLTEQAKKRMNLEVKLEVVGNKHRLDPLVETVLFRVAQEALTNVQRHAKTSSALIKLSYHNGAVSLTVCDEGVGFDPQAELLPPHGWGLAGMRERTESLDGTLEVKSAHGQGTTIKITIPLEKIEPSME